MKIYPPNSEVIVAGSLPALVQAVLIDDTKISYKCSPKLEPQSLNTESPER